MGPWAYGVLEGRQVDRWLASRAGWRADVLRDRTVAKNNFAKTNVSTWEIYLCISYKSCQYYLNM